MVRRLIRVFIYLVKWLVTSDAKRRVILIVSKMPIAVPFDSAQGIV